MIALLATLLFLQAPAPQIAPNSLERLQQATMLFAQNQDDAGAQAYFQGIDAWQNDDDAEHYLGDALLTASDEEVIPLTDGSLAKRANALKLFWKKRAVRDGTSIPAWLGEHYRRISFALHAYPRSAATGSPSRVVAVRHDGAGHDMDDRGVVYVRFGKPISTFSYAQRRKDVEAWLYRDTDGHNFSFYFDRGRVAADVISAMGSISADPAGKDMEAFEDLAQMDARYGFVVARLQSIHTYAFGRGTSSYNPQAIADRSEDIIRLNERISSDNAIRMGEEIGSDRAVPVFAKPLPVFHDFASFRGNGCTDVVYSILAQSNAYQLNVAVADTFTWETESVDTRVARGGPADSWLRATGVFCTFPRNNAYMRFTVASDDDRGVTAGGEIHIADYRGSDFMMSDLLFATTQPGPFVRGNAHLALVPPRQFKEGEAFRVFYELYNLPRGGRYKTEITFTTLESGLLMRVFRGHKQTTVSFDDEAQTDNVVQELRTLVPQVEPGRVEVKITVTDLASGQKATSKENIRILPKSM